MTCCRSTWTSYLIYLPHTHNSGANFFPPQLCAIKDLTPKNRRDEVRWQECENWGLDIEEEVRKMREEGCEGAGRSGSQREARLEASLFFFRLLQRDNDQTLRGRVCSRYSHLCFFYLFIYPVMTKRAHDTLSLPKSVTRLEIGARLLIKRGRWNQSTKICNGMMRRGRVRLFFSSPGPRMNSDTVDKRSGLRLDRTSLLLIQLPLLQLGWLVFTAGLTRAITD